MKKYPKEYYALPAGGPPCVGGGLPARRRASPRVGGGPRAPAGTPSDLCLPPSQSTHVPSGEQSSVWCVCILPEGEKFRERAGPATSGPPLRSLGATGPLARGHRSAPSGPAVRSLGAARGREGAGRGGGGGQESRGWECAGEGFCLVGNGGGPARPGHNCSRPKPPKARKVRKSPKSAKITPVWEIF